MTLEIPNCLCKTWTLTVCLQLLFPLLPLLRGMETNIYSGQANNEESITRNQDAFGYGCEISSNANKEWCSRLKIS